MPDWSKLSDWSFWKPTPGEVVLYLLIIFLLFTWAMLVHYSIIHRSVRKESRCYKQKRDYVRSGIYSVEAKDMYDRSMYRIDYDLANKSFKHACSCKDGDYANSFKIRVYDQKQKKAIWLDKNCMCDADFKTGDPLTDTTFHGYPGLVRFMQDGTPSFFTQELK